MPENAFDVEPGSRTPKVNTMTDFNIRCWNSRIFPAIDSLNVRLCDRVRIRVGNLTMTNHPIHLHGHEFTVTGTDGGPTPPASRWPEVTTNIPVGQMRQVEFVAVDHRGLVGRIQRVVPDYMLMGERGMADMGEMEMPLPDNTAPMMTGSGQYGALEMGGMFSVLKVRKDQKPDDYRDPGWFQHPAGPVAREYGGQLVEPTRMPHDVMPHHGQQPAAFDARKPDPHAGH